MPQAPSRPVMQRLVIVVSILASFVAFLDGSVINVALPAISGELRGGLVLQQWVVDAYLITLGALILVAGSLSDILGRKRILRIGLVGFLVTSLLCAVAPNGIFLVVARALQGVAGALLVPSSLALITSSIEGPAKNKAIGTWTAWTGISFIIGPLVGGLLVDSTSWRWIFAINVIPILVTLWLMRRLDVGEGTHSDTPIDIRGAVVCSVGLGGVVYALIEQAKYGWLDPMVSMPLTVGVVALAYFFWYERRCAHPMLPLELFRSRNFSAGNITTLFVYAGLSVATFLITIFVQQVSGYSAVQAGLATLPVTIIMFLLSPRFGALSAKFGPRLLMTLGPVVAGIGFLLMVRVQPDLDYWTQLLPGVVVFGLGLSMTVAPLTAAVLGSVDSNQAGIASAVNNAVARIAGLLAVACLGLVIGNVLDVDGFRRGMSATAILLFIGGVVSFFGITDKPEKLPLKV